ncbi:MAG: DUF1501 domain-containing protein [Bacteroidota bacterium]
MKRRTFLQRLASTGIVLPFALGYPRLRAFAKSPSGSPFMRLASATTDHVFVIIRLAGGNDGLNTVVPYGHSDYYTLRGPSTADNIAIPATDVLKLPDSSSMGLHPSLAPLLDLYKEKKMAIVQNVGYPNQNLSHFRSTDIWLSGSDAAVYDNAGWYAKYLEEKYPDYPTVLPTDPFAIEFGTFLSTTLVGEKNNMGIAVGTTGFLPNDSEKDPLPSNHEGDEEAYIRSIAKQANVFTTSIINAIVKQPVNKVTYPTGNALGTVLSAIPKLIAGGLATQMYIVNVGGYDTHSDQVNRQKQLHKDLADAVLAFQRDLEAFGLGDRVSTMTISEFGRRVVSNGGGTDHGSAAPLFVIGNGVNGGLFGPDPNLTDLEGPGNLKMQYDFRQVYASVLGQWFNADETLIQPKALPHHFDQIPIFKTATINGVDSASAIAGVQLGQNFPNPAASGTRIPIQGMISGMNARLTLYDIDGRAVLSRDVVAGETAIDLDTRTLPTGTYVYELSAAGARRAKTMIVAR